MILQRAIFLELFRPFLMTSGTVLFLMMMAKIQRLVTWMVDKRLSVSEVLLMTLYMLPPTIAMVIPLGVLGGVFMVIVRQSLDSELVAMRASGMGFSRLLKPIGLFGLGASLAGLLLSVWLQPLFNEKFRNLQMQVIKQHAQDSLIPGELNFEFGSKVIRVGGREPDGTFTNVFLSDQHPSSQSPVIMAQKGEIYTNETMRQVVFQIQNGAIYTRDPDKPALSTTSFKTLSYVLTLPSSLDYSIMSAGAMWSISTWQLIQELSSQRMTHDQRSLYLFELFNRLSSPFSCLAFSLAALPMAVVDPRAGKSAGFLRALLLVMVFWLLWVASRDLILAGRVPAMTLFLPSVLIGFYGWFSTLRLEQTGR
ncbi:MAG: LptF/LptG family permease [Deltaproteobacteria bacterium]|nr:LptF/LptG family permease [Deltaproteobacteria bacterium]